MKASFYSIAIIFCIPGLISCKKNAAAPAPVATTGTHPTFICHNYIASTPAYNNGTYFTIFDLNHDSNKDKKYFIVQFVGSKDSVQVITQPKPIDSLGLSWPAHVKTASWGFSGSLTVDAQTSIRSSSTSQSPGAVYRLDSMKDFPSSYIQTYNYLNNTAYAGSMAGIKPTAQVLVKVPTDVFGNYSFRQAIIYGKQRVYTNVVSLGNGVKSIDEVFTSPLSPGSSVGGFDWANVDCSVEQTITNGLSRYYFFDFKNWRYFTVTENYYYNSSTNVSSTFYTAIQYKSLDLFCKWPDGWKN